jgi:hypothetical protein
MKTALHLIIGASLLLVAGCAHYFVVDGYEASYADAPAQYERYPRYEYRGARVYEIGGHYYREYNGRWVVYRERPRELREWRGEERRDERREEIREERREERR